MLAFAERGGVFAYGEEEVEEDEEEGKSDLPTSKRV
jgi:hypothetical protein